MQISEKYNGKCEPEKMPLPYDEAKLARFSVELSADAIFWITPEGRFFYVNPAACKELGYSGDELKSLYVWDIDPLYTRERWHDIWEENKRQGSVKFETQHLTKAGEIIDVEIIANHVTYDDKEYSCAFSRDITERKRAEDALRESERKFRAIFEGTFQFLGLLTVDGRLLDVNRAALEAIAASKADMVGMPFWETPWCTFTPEISDKIKESIVRARRGEFVRFETVIEAVDGSLRNIDYSIKPMRDETGKIILLIPEGRDITAFKLTEEALRESEEKFRVLAETSTAAIFIYQGSRAVLVNKAAETVTGYSKDELLAMDYWDTVHPDYRDMVRKRSLARQHGEPVLTRYEVKLLTKSGETRWAELTAGRIMYRGRPAGVATIFDITDRKQVEEALSDAKARAELYLDLMSHDIRNYNQIALGFLELAMDVLDLDDGGRELLSKPVDAVNSSSRLIDNVVKLQRVTGGKALKNRRIDVCDILDKIKAGFSDIPGRRVAINYHPVPERYCIMANDLIYDVFDNLIGNSIKHTDPGRPLAIDIGVKGMMIGGREYLEISIEDNGPGIPDALKGKLFTRRERGMTKAGGRGLGLYLVRTLVADFGGTVRVEDRVPGNYRKGARFVVVLPAIDNDAA